MQPNNLDYLALAAELAREEAWELENAGLSNGDRAILIWQLHRAVALAEGFKGLLTEVAPRDKRIEPLIEELRQLRKAVGEL